VVTSRLEVIFFFSGDVVTTAMINLNLNLKFKILSFCTHLCIIVKGETSEGGLD